MSTSEWYITVPTRVSRLLDSAGPRDASLLPSKLVFYDTENRPPAIDDCITGRGTIEPVSEPLKMIMADITVTSQWMPTITTLNDVRKRGWETFTAKMSRENAGIKDFMSELERNDHSLDQDSSTFKAVLRPGPERQVMARWHTNGVPVKIYSSDPEVTVNGYLELRFWVVAGQSQQTSNVDEQGGDASSAMSSSDT